MEDKERNKNQYNTNNNLKFNIDSNIHDDCSQLKKVNTINYKQSSLNSITNNNINTMKLELDDKSINNNEKSEKSEINDNTNSNSNRYMNNSLKNENENELKTNFKANKTTNTSSKQSCMLSNTIETKITKLDLYMKEIKMLDNLNMNSQQKLKIDRIKQGDSLDNQFKHHDSEIVFIKVALCYFLDCISCKRGKNQRKIIQEYQHLKENVDNKLDIKYYFDFLFNQEFIKLLLLDEEQSSKLKCILDSQ